MSRHAPDWLTARPIAHRGLHDASRGVAENSLAAARAACAASFSVECDVQLSADGEAMVFHDETLERLTLGEGQVHAMTASALGALPFRTTGNFMPTLQQLLAEIGGRAPLICEIKSNFDGDLRLANRVRVIAAAYSGALAFKSFDPDVIAHLRADAVPRPLGVVAEADYSGPYWRALTPLQKDECTNFLHYERTRPDFLSWSVSDLPHPTPFLLRKLAQTPVMAWTVRSPGQRSHALLWADQIVFEDAGLAD